MTKSKSQPKGKAPKLKGPSIFSKPLAWWKQKFPILIFVTLFAILIALFYVFWLSDFFTTKIQPHLLSVNAFLSNILLNIAGQHTTQQGEIISSSKFAISVSRGCDGIEGMAMFAAAMLAFPMQWKRKIKVILIGVAILFFLNLIRIVSLFLIGIYYPSAFQLMHVEVWQALFIFFALSLWIYFIVSKSNPPVKHVAP